MPSNRTSSCRGFSAKLELAGKQLLYACVIHEQHDEVDRLRACLEAKIPATNRDKRRRAPAVLTPAGDNSASMLAADDESALPHVGNHRDTPGASEHFLRNTLIGRSHNLLQCRARCLQTIFRRWPSRFGERES